MAAELECRAAGTVVATQLEDVRERLVGLSGLPGRETCLHELALRSCIPDRPELLLQHSLPAAGAQQEGEAGRWTATQSRLPLDGRAAADLPASVRSVVRTQCSGPDVLGFWRALGFGVQYQMIKQGSQFEVEHAGHLVQVLLCRVLRVLPECQPPQGGEELSPGHWLVEASTAVDGGAYAEAAAALGSLSKLLAPYTALQPLPTGRGRARPAG